MFLTTQHHFGETMLFKLMANQIRKDIFQALLGTKISCWTKHKSWAINEKPPLGWCKHSSCICLDLQCRDCWDLLIWKWWAAWEVNFQTLSLFLLVLLSYLHENQTVHLACQTIWSGRVRNGTSKSKSLQTDPLLLVHYPCTHCHCSVTLVAEGIRPHWSSYVNSGGC